MITKAHVKVREKPKVQVRRSVTRANGLCSTCANAKACFLNADYDRPVVFCEEYYGAPLRTPDEIAGEKTQGGILQDSTVESRREAGDFQGLCVNCSHIKSCVFATPGSNILECNEYS